MVAIDDGQCIRSIPVEVIYRKSRTRFPPRHSGRGQPVETISDEIASRDHPVIATHGPDPWGSNLWPAEARPHEIASSRDALLAMTTPFDLKNFAFITRAGHSVPAALSHCVAAAPRIGWRARRGAEPN